MVAPLLPDYPFEPFSPGHNTRDESFFANFIENRIDGSLQVLPAPAIEIGQFLLEIPEEEEVTRSKVWAVGWMLQPRGSMCRKTFLRPSRITRACIVKMDHESLQRLPTTIKCNSADHTWNNLITEECCIICAPFRNVKHSLDAVDGPKDGN
jgi:hypothetical protein